MNTPQSIALGSNNLQTSTNYGWTHILNTVKRGGKVASVNDTVDAAIQAHKDAFSQSAIAYYVLNFMATFNASIIVPDLNRASFQSLIVLPASALLNDVAYNFRLPIPLSAGVMRRTDTQLWKTILMCYQVLKGKNYVPTDIEFNTAWTFFKGQSAAFTIIDVYNSIVAFQKSTVFNKDDSANYLIDARTVGITPILNVPQNDFFPDFGGLDYLQDDNNPAFTITRRTTMAQNGSVLNTSFSMKMRVKAFSDMGNINISNVGYVKSGSPFQYLLHGAIRNQLVGAIVTVDAGNFADLGLIANAGSDINNVSFVHVAYNAQTNNHMTLGFRVTAVEKVVFVGDTVLLSLTVVDSQPRTNALLLSQTLSYNSPTATNASSPTVVVACSDARLEVHLNLVLTDIYTKPR
jgi:hypothetical protein